MDQATQARLKAQLEDELGSLGRQLADHGVTGDDVEVGVDEGFADSGQATAERSEALGLIDKLLGARREVTEALARIEAGTYGRCERCGQDIDLERLEALPSTALCVSCKQSLAS